VLQYHREFVCRLHPIPLKLLSNWRVSAGNADSRFREGITARTVIENAEICVEKVGVQIGLQNEARTFGSVLYPLY
jgi:hypothetical protein